MRYVGERYQNWSVSRYLSLSADDQASVMAEAPLRFTEVEDDYGTNPTHEPTETRSRCNGNRRRAYCGQRNEDYA